MLSASTSHPGRLATLLLPEVVEGRTGPLVLLRRRLEEPLAEELLQGGLPATGRAPSSERGVLRAGAKGNIPKECEKSELS